FIRKADFDPAAKEFAFLVPTPGKPTLSLSDNELFRRLRTVMKEVVVTRKPRFVWGEPDGDVTGSVPKTSAAPAGSVRVESSQTIGGFNTVVLKASDTDSLVAWLQKHGYKPRPEMREWLEPYVRGGYFVTAFRVAAGNPALSPVCMTFQTPAPFYPYREPDSTAPRTGRNLRVYYLGDKRVVGNLGGDAGTTWNATPLCSRRLTPGQKSVLTAPIERFYPAIAFKGSKPPRYPTIGLTDADLQTRLTVFDDAAPLRERKDLFFAASPEQTEIFPTRTEYDDIDVAPAVLALGGLVFAGTALAGFLRWRRR
ncbi:MAG: DUF2330 domain-containing protein, partial [Armatimonadetes bacterium]|nr:DUF2330 domain-containing protein [Armatimonadota bacterium]